MKKKEFAELVFCAIEAGDTAKVKDLYNLYPEFKNKVVDRNNWTPVMYACRYGNVELLTFFVENAFILEIPGTYGLLHIASFSGELPVLRYLIEKLKKDPNPLTVETIPLRFACKYQRYECIDYLFHKGAFLIDGNYIHNLVPYLAQEVRDGQSGDRIRYKTLGGMDIIQNIIFKVHELKDEKIKYFIRWLRFRNFAFVSNVVEKSVRAQSGNVAVGNMPMGHIPPPNKKLEMFKNHKVRKTIAMFL